MTRTVTKAVMSVVVVIALGGGGATAALASFDSQASESQAVLTATLQPPTNPSTAAGPCTASVSASIVVSWTATTSTWADGYEVLSALTSGGPYTLAASVNGSATTTATIGGLQFSTTYYFVVRARKLAWRSANTTQVSRATLNRHCA